MVQNAAARLLTGMRKFQHITPILTTLQWLPVKLRVEYNILTLVFKALNNLAPILPHGVVANTQICEATQIQIFGNFINA